MSKDRADEVSAITITQIPDKLWLGISDIVMPFCRNPIEVKLCHTLANELWQEALRHANEQLVIQSLEVDGTDIVLTARKVPAEIRG